jgi:hypothetical protein
MRHDRDNRCPSVDFPSDYIPKQGSRWRAIRAKKSPCEGWLRFLVGQKRSSSRLVILKSRPMSPPASFPVAQYRIASPYQNGTIVVCLRKTNTKSFVLSRAYISNKIYFFSFLWHKISSHIKYVHICRLQFKIRWNARRRLFIHPHWYFILDTMDLKYVCQ